MLCHLTWSVLDLLLPRSDPTLHRRTGVNWFIHELMAIIKLQSSIMKLGFIVQKHLNLMKPGPEESGYEFWESSANIFIRTNSGIFNSATCAVQSIEKHLNSEFANIRKND